MEENTYIYTYWGLVGNRGIRILLYMGMLFPYSLLTPSKIITYMYTHMFIEQDFVSRCL